jgi:hypothetical protein
VLDDNTIRELTKLVTDLKTDLTAPNNPNKAEVKRCWYEKVKTAHGEEAAKLAFSILTLEEGRNVTIIEHMEVKITNKGARMSPFSSEIW